LPDPLKNALSFPNEPAQANVALLKDHRVAQAGGMSANEYRAALSSAHRNSDFGARVYLIEKKDGVRFGNGNSAIRRASLAI
jgi:hypothetical protein